MKCLPPLSLLGLWLVVAPAPAVAAQTVALLPPSGVNLHDGILGASRDVLKGHLLRTGRFAVLTPAGRSTTDELSPQQAADQAKAVGAELGAVLRITRLGNAATVSLTVYRAADAQVVHFDDLQAATPDDLDPVLSRLANSFATGKPARLSGDIYNVTQKESDPLMKRSTTRTVGVHLGGMMALNRAGGDVDSVPGVGVFWLYDARTWLAELALDLHVNDDNTVFSVGLGGYYPFSRDDLTPYVGGGIKFAASRFGGETANGLVMHAAAGMLFGRLSTMQFRGEIGYFANTYGERDNFDYSVVNPTQPTTKYYSHGPCLSVGLGF